VGVSEYWTLYENGSFGEKGELALVVDRRAAFFLSFFAVLVGFFATLDFLVFLAIAITFLRAGSGDWPPRRGLHNYNALAGLRVPPELRPRPSSATGLQ